MSAQEKPDSADSREVVLREVIAALRETSSFGPAWSPGGIYAKDLADRCEAALSNSAPARQALEPVAEVLSGYQLLWAGAEPLATLLKRHPGVKVGSKLYAASTAHWAPSEQEIACAFHQFGTGRWDGFLAAVRALEKPLEACRQLEQRCLQASEAEGSPSKSMTCLRCDGRGYFDNLDECRLCKGAGITALVASLADEPVARCDACNRAAFKRTLIGSRCGFPQPGGFQCVGIFQEQTR